MHQVFLKPKFKQFSLMTATEKQKRLTLTENRDVALRFDNGDPGPLRTLHIMLAITDRILHLGIPIPGHFSNPGILGLRYC